MLRKILVLLLALSLGLPLSLQAATIRFEIDNPVYNIDGEEHTAEDMISPYIDRATGRAMLPLRSVAEALGARVSWNPDTRRITIARDGTVLTIPVDEPLSGDMGTPAIVDGRSFVPIAYVAQELGAETRWDAEARAIYIYDRGHITPHPMPTFDPIDPDSPYMPSAYDFLSDAMAVIMENDSLAMLAKVDIKLTAGPIRLDVQAEYTMEFVIHETGMDKRIEVTSNVMGEEISILTYYRDGTMYTYHDGEWISYEVPLSTMMRQNELFLMPFPEASIIEQNVSRTSDGGNTLLFVVDGAAMQEVFDAMLSGIEQAFPVGGIEISAETVQMTAQLNELGLLRNKTMVLSYVMAMDGMSFNVELEVSYEITQMGGLSINFPTVLDSLR